MDNVTALFVAFMFGAINALLVAAIIEHYTGRRRAVKLGRALLAECGDDTALAWAEIKLIRQANDNADRMIRAGMRALCEKKP